jgi:acyl dehydratase
MPEYEEVEVGDEVELTRTVTEEDVRRFAEISGDQNLIHTDKEFAAKTRFKKPIVHGMFTASLFSNLVGNKLPGNGSVYLTQDLNFKKPVYIGDTIRAKLTIIRKVDGPKILVLKTTACNQDDEVVLTGKAQVTWARSAEE